MKTTGSPELQNRVHDRVGAWGIAVERVTETESSVLAFGRRNNQPVVLKVIKRPGEEWRSGEILEAFEGRGIVRVYEYVDRAIVLERLSPAGSLVDMALNGADDEATAILARTMRTMARPRQQTCSVVGLCAGGALRHLGGRGRVPSRAGPRVHSFGQCAPADVGWFH